MRGQNRQVGLHPLPCSAARSSKAQQAGAPIRWPAATAAGVIQREDGERAGFDQDAHLLLGLLPQPHLFLPLLQMLRQQPPAVVQLRHEEARHGEPGDRHQQPAERPGHPTGGIQRPPAVAPGRRAEPTCRRIEGLPQVAAKQRQDRDLAARSARAPRAGRGPGKGTRPKCSAAGKSPQAISAISMPATPQTIRRLDSAYARKLSSRVISTQTQSGRFRPRTPIFRLSHTVGVRQGTIESWCRAPGRNGAVGLPDPGVGGCPGGRLVGAVHRWTGRRFAGSIRRSPRSRCNGGWKPGCTTSPIASAMCSCRWPNIAPDLQHAVIAAEDGRFYQHHGIDWKEVQKVVDQDSTKASSGRGGSTITQQLVKNLFLTTSRVGHPQGRRVHAGAGWRNWSFPSSASWNCT